MAGPGGYRVVKLCLGLLLGLCLSACTPRPLILAHNPTPYERESPTLFYFYLPEGYTTDREWPVFVGIHGFGSDGEACLQMWQPYADQAGFVLVCPSLSEESGGWYQDAGSRMLKAVMKEVRKECHVQDKFFLAGFSAGAQFVQGFAFDYPSSVTGTAVLSAGNYYEPSQGAHDVPFLVVIGDQDNPAGVKTAGEFRDLLKQAGYSVEFHLLPGIGHTVTDQALDLTIDFYRRIYRQ